MNTPASPAAREAAELLPCPLCGQSPSVGQVKAGVEWWQVECEAERGDGCGLVIMRSTRNAAVSAWNTRPDHQTGDAGPVADMQWMVEPLKRFVIKAIVDHSKGGGMAVTAREAADAIMALYPRPSDRARIADYDAALLDGLLSDLRDSSRLPVVADQQQIDALERTLAALSTHAAKGRPLSQTDSR